MTKKVDLEYDNRTGAEFSDEQRKSSGSKKSILFLFALALLIGSAISTQYTASVFNYQQALGWEIAKHIYFPFAYFIWSFQYWDQYPEIFQKGLKYFYLSFVPLLLIAVIKNYAATMKLKADKYLQGSARWANLKDIQDAALLPSGKDLKLDVIEWEYAHAHLKKSWLGKKIWELRNKKPTHERKGVFVGSWIDPVKKRYYYLRDYSKTHVLMIAKTRAGKGVGPINDTVGSWDGSMFVYDIKGELWALFSGRRKEMEQNVMRFAPRTRRRDMNAILDKEGKEIGRKYDNCTYFEDEKNGDDSMISCTDDHSKLEIKVVYKTIQVHGKSVSVYANGIDEEGKPVPSETIEEYLNGNRSELPEIKGLYDLENPNNKVKFGNKLTKPLYNTVRWNPFDTIQYEGATEFYYQEKSKEQYEKDKAEDPNTPRGYLASRICNGDREIADIQNVTELIINPDGKTEVNHWTDSAKSLIQAAICYVLHNLPEMACPKAVDWMLSGMIDFAEIRKLRQTNQFVPEWDKLPRLQSSDAMPTVYSEMMQGLDWQGKTYKASALVVREAKKQYSRPKDEGGSVLSSAQRFFLTYSDTLVADATSKSDFDIKQLMNLEKPCSLFMVVQPEDKDALKPVVRLLINRILRMLAADMHFQGGRSINGFNHRLLLMIDEMPTLGKLDILQEALGYMAGYGLKAFMVTQDITQLKDNYGDKESIRANCQVKMYYATSNEETAREMSAEFGTTTRIKESVSISGEGFKKSRSRSIQETARPLLSVDECMNLRGAITAENGDIIKAGAMAIKATGFPGIMGEQPLYFQNPELLRRAQLPTLKGSDQLLKYYNGKKITIGDEDKLTEESVKKINLAELQNHKK